jgi:hypothetical protein
MWTFGGTRIYVQNLTGNRGQIIARLQPVSGGTKLQLFGYESLIRNVSAIVVGDANLSALETMSKSGNAYALVGPEGNLGSYYVKTLSFSRVNTICQTIDTTQPEDTPVYTVEIELHRED